MSDRAWGHLNTVLGLLSVALVAAFFAWGIWDIATLNARDSIEADQQAKQHADSAEGDIERACVGLDPSTLNVCVEEKIKASREAKRAEDDLTAQKAMARYAGWLLAATALSVLVTAVGVYFVRDTLIANRGMLKEAQITSAATLRAVGHAEETSRLELRAYLSVEPAGINQLIGSRNGMGHVTVRNVGRLPAREVSVQVRMTLRLIPSIKFSKLAEHRSVERVIQPGAHMTQGSGAKDIGSFRSRGLYKYAFVWGIVHYTDGYGCRRYTRFCHRYATASYNREIDQASFLPPVLTRPIIEAEKARYHPYGNDAD